MKTNHLYPIAICVLLLHWLGAEWRSWQLNSEIKRVYSKDVTIKAVDADTKEPLPIELRSNGTILDQHWPKEFRITATDERSELRVHWIDITSVEVGVSSEGYAEQQLQLDQRSEDRVVVSLRR